MTEGRDEPDVRQEILEFIGRPIYPYLVTTTRAGVPYLRPVICVNDGFTIRMITRSASKKVQHIRRNPMVSIFWSSGEGTPPRSVMLQARVSLLSEAADIESFAAGYMKKNPQRTRALPAAGDELSRVVLRAEPTFLRADGFRGFRPVILRVEALQ